VQKRINKVSIIVSVFNEEQVLPLFWEELSSHIAQLGDKSFEIIWVNDGSSDSSQMVLDGFAKTEKVHFVHLEFSKNFGHEAAMIAGIDHASGDLIICMDSDLQHPPSKIPEMLAEYERGSDIVTMSRMHRDDNGFLKNAFSKLFYKLMNGLSDYKFEAGASDFFLISERVADVLRSNFRERNRFLRGYIQIVGFNRSTLEFDAGKRAAGESKYSYSKLASLANIAIFSFSRKPLYLALVVAVAFMVLTSVVAVYSLIVYFFGDRPYSGYTTIVVFISVCFTILYFLLAILSIYIGKGIEEIKERPIYLLKNAKGVEQDSDEDESATDTETSEQ
jgi:glycosyltransferase involved in cell wall biosynthesis